MDARSGPYEAVDTDGVFVLVRKTVPVFPNRLERGGCHDVFGIGKSIGASHFSAGIDVQPEHHAFRQASRA